MLVLLPADNAVVVRARMRTEIEAGKRKLTEAEAAAAAQAEHAGPKEVTLDGAPMMPSVLYCCPEIGPEVLPKEEMEAHIQEFLYNRYCEPFQDSRSLLLFIREITRDMLDMHHS